MKLYYNKTSVPIFRSSIFSVYIKKEIPNKIRHRVRAGTYADNTIWGLVMREPKNGY